MQKPVSGPESLSYRIENPEEFARNMMRVFEEGGRAVAKFLERPSAQVGPYSLANEMTEATRTLTDIATSWMTDPARYTEANTRLWQTYAEIWNNTLHRMAGDNPPPVVQPDPGDNRFKDPEWVQNPVFDFVKQAYLATSKWAEQMLAETEGLDQEARRKAEFYLRLMTSSFSPTNIPFLNPEVLRETFEKNAENLVSGMNLLAEDMGQSGDLLKISQTDISAFEVGKNLALTPGKVVFQNEIIQLIQYSPSTDKVRELPLLIVPPWINKYYILDLTPQKSFIKYIVSKGFTVFVISWVNPDENLSHKTFEDYMQEGVIAAIDAVRRECGTETINALGYCVGGTMLSTTLAYLAARGEDIVNSATLLATQVDFTSAGDLLLFTETAQLDALDELMTERGFLDGSRMANVFNMMRPRDLIWPYVVNNYLLGKKPFPFDLLFWNQDSTRMTAANHKFYLREFYNQNKLATGDLKISGTPLDLATVKIPVFEVATREDHIAPAVSVFRGTKLFGKPVEFVLAGSGHIAGIVNPPDKVKYQFWINGSAASEKLEDWQKSATETPGSWWPYWIKWLTDNSGALTLPRDPGEKLGVIEDAPGSYVKTKG